MYSKSMQKTLVDPNVIKAALLFRHAAKRFDPGKTVSDNDFDLILEAGQLSPSSFGREPWNIIVAGKKLREELVPLCWGAQGQLPTASHFLIFTAKTSAAMMPDAPYPKQALTTVRGMNDAEADEYLQWYEKWLKEDYGRLDAPQLLHEWTARQAYIAAGNMMTVAAMRGVDSCAIEGFTVLSVTELLAQKKLIDPEQDLPVLMLAFGYRVDPPKLKTRRDVARIMNTTGA